MELEAEKFKSAQELAAIHTAISEGRAQLAALESGKELFMRQREDELREHLATLLEETGDTIAEIATNQRHTVAYREQAESFVRDIAEAHQELAARHKIFNTLTEGIKMFLVAKTAELKRIQADQAIQGQRIKAETKHLAAQREQLRELTLQLEDKQKMLADAFEELRLARS